MDVINNISNFFAGTSNLPANPDPTFNAMLLQEAKRKVETGIFTRFFKKPVIIGFEIISYTASILFLIAGMWFFIKIDVALTFIQNGGQIIEYFADRKWNLNVIHFLEILLFVLSISPALISFLLGRLFTQSRKRITIFREVENMIDRVIYNLNSNKK
jgi:hypothetical protein